MWKVIGGVFVGVFVGAMLFEILNRRHPHLLRGIENKAKRTVRAAADAFEEGYHGKRATADAE